MPSGENKELVRRYYEDIVSTGEIEAVPQYISPDYVEIHDGERHPAGLEGAREHIRGVRRTYPDLRLTVEQQIAEGEWVVSRVTMRGTHRGEWMGIKPTGERVVVTAVNIDRVVSGRIVEHGGAANLLEPLLKIGAVHKQGTIHEPPIHAEREPKMVKRPRGLLIATAIVGAISLIAFLFERLALTDIFHGEPDVHLEWAVVNGAFIPITLFHVLGLVALFVALRHMGRRRNPPEGAA